MQAADPTALYLQTLARLRAAEAEREAALIACRAAKRALDAHNLRRAEAATKARKP